jgi:two-component system response regulator AdeR
MTLREAGPIGVVARDHVGARLGRNGGPARPGMGPVRFAQAESPSVPGRIAEPHGVTVDSYRDALGLLLSLGGSPPSAVLVPTDVRGAELLDVVSAITSMTDVPVLVGMARHDGAAELARTAIARGARSILPLPCSREQVTAAVRSLGLRPAGGTSGVLEIGPLRLDAEAFRASVDGRVVPLTPREFLLLATLMRAHPRVMRVDDLAHGISTHADGNPMATRALVLRVRRKLEEALRGAGDQVETVRGVGYRIRSI